MEHPAIDELDRLAATVQQASERLLQGIESIKDQIEENDQEEEDCVEDDDEDNDDENQSLSLSEAERREECYLVERRIHEHKEVENMRSDFWQSHGYIDEDGEEDVGDAAGSHSLFDHDDGRVLTADELEPDVYYHSYSFEFVGPALVPSSTVLSGEEIEEAMPV